MHRAVLLILISIIVSSLCFVIGYAVLKLAPVYSVVALAVVVPSVSKIAVRLLSIVRVDG